MGPDRLAGLTLLYLHRDVSVKLRSHSARSAANRRSPSGWLRGQPLAALRAQSRQHGFCIERSHSAADRAVTGENALKVEIDSTLRAFPSVAARSAAVDGGRERSTAENLIFIPKIWPRGERRIADRRAVSDDSPLVAPLSSPLAARCENAPLKQLMRSLTCWLDSAREDENLCLSKQFSWSKSILWCLALDHAIYYLVVL